MPPFNILEPEFLKEFNRKNHQQTAIEMRWRAHHLAELYTNEKSSRYFFFAGERTQELSFAFK
jgi:hypothetical protein